MCLLLLKISWTFLPFLTARRCASADISRHCVSVYLCVTRRYCIKAAKHKITQTTPRGSPGTLVSWRQNSLMDDSPFPLKFALKVTDPLRKLRFRPISAHSASTVRAGERRSISTNRKSTTLSQWATDEPCTLSPPKVGTKHDFAVFANKI